MVSPRRGAAFGGRKSPASRKPSNSKIESVAAVGFDLLLSYARSRDRYAAPTSAELAKRESERLKALEDFRRGFDHPPWELAPRLAARPKRQRRSSRVSIEPAPELPVDDVDDLYR